MNQNRIEEIRARCEAATPGPWMADTHAIFVSTSDHKGFYPICKMRGWGHLTGKGHGALGLDGEAAFDRQKADQDFIAFARADIPFLLDELASRDARIEELRKERNAAIAHLKAQMYCPSCKHSLNYPDFYPCSECREHEKKYEWRGPKED